MGDIQEKYGNYKTYNGNYYLNRHASFHKTGALLLLLLPRSSSARRWPYFRIATAANLLVAVGATSVPNRVFRRGRITARGPPLHPESRWVRDIENPAEVGK